MIEKGRFSLHSIGTGFLILAGLSVPLLFPLLPTQDGPSHAENAALLGQALAGRDLFGNLIEFQPHLFSNWASHLFLAFTQIFLSPANADRFLYALCIVCFVFALRPHLKTEEQRSSLYAYLLSVPFLLPIYLALGFYNFSLGVSGYLFYLSVLGRSDLSDRVLVATALNCVLTLIHPLIGAVAIATTVVFRLLNGVAGGNAGSRAKLTLSKLSLIIVPAAILLICGALQLRGLVTEVEVQNATFSDRLSGLISSSVLISYAPEALIFGRFFGTILCAAMVSSIWKKWRTLPPQLLAGVITCFSVYLLMPGKILGGSHLTDRMSVLPLLLSVMTVSAVRIPARFRRLLTVAAVLTGFPIFFLNFPRLSEAEHQLAEYKAIGSGIKARSEILPLWLCDRTSLSPLTGCSQKVFMFAHAEGFLAAGLSLQNLANYEPRTGHFPFAFRAEMNPWGTLIARTEGMELGGPSIDLYQWESGRKALPDYLLVLNLEAGSDWTTRVFGESSRSKEIFLERYREKERSASGRLLLFESRPSSAELEPASGT